MRNPLDRMVRNPFESAWLALGRLARSVDAVVVDADDWDDSDVLDVGPCNGLWRHCAYKCDLVCDHDVWCADCERKYPR